MVSWKTGALLVGFTAAMALLAAPASAKDKCVPVPVKGTITGHFDFSPEPAWYGKAFLTLGKKGKTVTALLVDRSAGTNEWEDASGNFGGDEVLTFTVEGGGEIQVSAHFTAIAGEQPFFFWFAETGTITGGTGEYKGAEGTLGIQGSFAAGYEWSPQYPWLWIAMVNGSVCGVK